MIRLMTAALGAVLLATTVQAQDNSGGDIPEPRVYESTGQVNANGTRVRYTVTAGETYLRDADGNPTASIFSTTYIADGHADPRTRPADSTIQGAAADIVKRAMLLVQAAIDERKLNARLLLQVHDELVLDVPDEERLEVECLVRDAMIGAAKLKVPLEVSLGVGKNWLEAH